jgi:hypothetical protein
MPTNPSSPKAAQLRATARSNPEFALRLARQLAPGAQQRFAFDLARPERAASNSKRPGLAKCAPSPFAESNGFTAQLTHFALAGRR